MTGLPPGWVEADLGSILAPLGDGRLIHQGWSPQCEKEPRGSEDEWGALKTTAIQAGAYEPEHNKRLPDHLEPRELLEAHAGDLLITSAGPRARCGVPCLVRTTPRRLMISGKMYRFRVDPRFVDARYVEAYLLSGAAERAIDAMKTGISDSGLNLTHKRFTGLRVPLAPLAEQRRIVGAIEEQLSRLDAAVAGVSAALARTFRVEEAVYSAAIRTEWPTVPLGELLREPLRNGVSAKSSPSGTVRIVTLTAVTRGVFAEANTKLADVDLHRVAGLWLEAGDILIERSNTPELVGTAALYSGEPEWAIFPDLLIRVRPDETLLPEFLALFLKTKAARGYFQRAAQGISGSMPKIGQDDIRRLLVPLPTVDEQADAVAEARRALALVASLRVQLNATVRRAASLRHSIFTAAFRGELVPQGLDDEPASVLLERIAAERAAAVKPARRRSEKVPT